MRSMWWQLGILRTNSAFAYRHRETKKTCVEVAGRRTFRVLTFSQQGIGTCYKLRLLVHLCADVHCVGNMKMG